MSLVTPLPFNLFAPSIFARFCPPVPHRPRLCGIHRRARPGRRTHSGRDRGSGSRPCEGLLSTLPKATKAKLVPIVKPDAAITKQYQEKYHLESTPTYTDLEAMLNKERPDVVLIYTTIKDHRRMVEAVSKDHVSSMMEKPLAISLEDALAIRKTAQDNHVHVLVNYDTNYYPNNTDAIRLAQEGKCGQVLKVMYYAGHEGPKDRGRPRRATLAHRPHTERRRRHK